MHHFHPIAFPLIIWWFLLQVSFVHSNEDYRHRIQFWGQENLTVFWINLESNPQRRDYTKHMLEKLHFPHKRVEAVDISSKEFRKGLVELEKPCKRNTDKDIAVIMSHLKAIYQAVYLDPNPSNEFAMIIEDDIKFLFSVNITALIHNHLRRPSFPRFGILQLTTSNPDAANSLWSNYKKDATVAASTDAFWQFTHWTNATRNGKAYLYWSAQAYIVNKPVIKSFLDDVVRPVNASEPDGPLEYHIVNSFYPERCSRSRARPCVLSNCLFADTYIYAGGGPTYIASVPFVTGGKIGLNSTIHQEQVSEHKEGFQAIRSVVHSARSLNLTLPDFIHFN